MDLTVRTNERPGTLFGSGERTVRTIEARYLILEYAVTSISGRPAARGIRLAYLTDWVERGPNPSRERT